MNYYENHSKMEKVLFIEKDNWSPGQSKTIAVRYLNRFAIEEDDQFEIATVQTLDILNENDVCYKLDTAMTAVDNLTKQQNKGMSYFHRISVFKR